MTPLSRSYNFLRTLGVLQSASLQNVLIAGWVVTASAVAVAVT